MSADAGGGTTVTLPDDPDAGHDPQGWADREMAQIMDGVQLVQVDLGPATTEVTR